MNHAIDPKLTLISVLVQLEIVGIKIHKRSHVMTLMGANLAPVNTTWIPLPIVDTTASFAEIVSVRK